MNSRAHQVRQITMPAAGSPTVTMISGQWFPLQVLAGAKGSGDDQSPRQQRSRTDLQWRTIGVAPGPGALDAATRLDVIDPHGATTTFELLDRADTVAGLGPGDTLSAPALDIAVLYPTTATVRELAGADVQAGVKVAIWEAGEATASQRGRSAPWDAEAPVDFWAALSGAANRELVVNGQAFKIVAPVLHRVQPRVRFGLQVGQAR